MTTSNSNTPPLLRLPLEIRRQIYTHLLPHTTTTCPDSPPRLSAHYLLHYRNPKFIVQPPTLAPGTDIVWRRGSTALLTVSRQLHEETTSMLYGENTFVIDVKFSGVEFRYRWITSHGLTPKRQFAFLDHFSARNVLRIKKYVVNVEAVDDYTGMIKYNCGGRGLPVGLKARVQELVSGMGGGLREVRVHLIDDGLRRVEEKVGEGTHGVLEPFGGLRGVRWVKVTGVSEEYAGQLEGSMMMER